LSTFCIPSTPEIFPELAEQGMIIDPILNSLSEFLSSVPTYAFTTLNLLAHNIITFFVPSSSGEAALTMPVLAIAKIRFSQWFKVIFPFFLVAWPLAAILAWVSAYG
jgi:uncharacterized ion transporter superfamily protein YfcC